MTRNIKFFGLLGLFLFFFIFTPASSEAIEYGGIGGRPAFPDPRIPRTESIFIYTLEPGTVREDGVQVINNTEQTKTLLVYAADSTPSTDGAFACKQYSEAKTDVGSWIKLESEEITLEPNKTSVIPFTITVPENASVGEQNGCILIQEKKEASEQSGMNLSTRTGLRVAVLIPGEIIRKLEIAGFSVEKNDAGNFMLLPKVKNTGNVSIDTQVDVSTKNVFGKEIFHHGGQYPILRDQTSDWNFELQKPFWGGWYQSTFSLQFDEHSEASIGVSSGKALTTLESPTVWFFSVPKPSACVIELGVLLFIAAIIFLLCLYQKRKKWIKKTWTPYKAKSGDNLQKLAKKYHISWKLLAKVNKLKPPYALKSGTKIKVPPAK